jgi:cation diffusion facilitator family transporter
MSTEGGTKAVLAALAANSGIAVAKFGGFALTGSSSMLSEAIHSVADSLNQVLLLVGSRRASREASDHHQFGYGRVRYLYGFVVAIVLFIVGGAYSIYEGWHKLHDPHPHELLVAVKIGVAPDLTAAQIAAGIDDVEARLRSAVPSAVYVFVEPDIDRG